MNIAKLDKIIAETRERLTRLEAARAIFIELDGGRAEKTKAKALDRIAHQIAAAPKPEAPAKANGHPIEIPAALAPWRADADGPVNLRRKTARLAIIRHLQTERGGATTEKARALAEALGWQNGERKGAQGWMIFERLGLARQSGAGKWHLKARGRARVEAAEAQLKERAAPAE